MIAEVIPLIRLPRRFTFFDYGIPDNIEHRETDSRNNSVEGIVSLGDIVKINFKGREVLGVVRGLKKESEHKVHNITSIVEPKFLNQFDISRLEAVALNIAQSPATIFYTALYGYRDKRETLKSETINYPKLSLDKQTAQQVSTALAELKKSNQIFCQTSIEGALTLAYALTKQFKNQILILAPHERDVKVIHKLINFKSKTALLHGKTPSAERNAVIQLWQSGEIKVLISTRQGSLLPAKKIEAIIVTDTNSIDHKNWDRNPRYDARLAVEQLAKQHSAKLIFTGSIPRTKDIFEKRKIIFYKHPIPPSTFLAGSRHDLSNGGTSNIQQIINLSAHEESTGLPMISETLKEQIEITLNQNKSALLVYNRKGVANRLQCSVCNHIPFCGTCGANPVVRADDLLCPVCKTEMWIPVKCPACGSDKLKQRGVGNKRLKSELQKLFPDHSIAIIDKQQFDNIKADILLVTEYFFQAIHTPFMKKRFGLVADICIDLGLGGNYDSAEITAVKLQRLLFLANQQKANCFVQTWIPEEIKKMNSLTEFLHSEVEIRAKYQLFPAFESISKRCPGKNLEYMLKSSAVDIQTKQSLTSVPNSCIIETELRNYDT